MYSILRLLTLALEAPFTVRSLTTEPARRPWIRPLPMILPSVGVRGASSGRAECVKSPISLKVLGSKRTSIRSRTFIFPAAKVVSCQVV